MNALAPYMAALHQQHLLEQAELDRLARRSRSAADPGVAGWRRGLGGGANRLSGLFASAARTLDPTIRTDRAAGRTTEHPTVGRALAC
jgi:hypothetical protein